MSFEFLNSTPIYLQIVEHIKTQIISKKYLPNQKIPSVRELSLMFEVNPNTVQKALSSLEDEGLIYTERTNGKYVTNNESLIKLVNILDRNIDKDVANKINKIIMDNSPTGGGTQSN